ncbi:Maf/Ham1 [Fistulina hepatica ATCC 64428]|uniref:Inosine triphosphate pyrophosphatase n=1 Tax=Fistulina hepatica ATCC 64428 TaxID=1128425 RepID=A0A0D7AN50_9AGAR|nr:Maf/Ham1 [Fistulina hepatica ATCC 64428]
MPKISECTSSIYSALVKKIAFVTGNANKLREVKAILSSGAHPIEIDSQSLDIPEVQGSTQEVAIAKCRMAAKLLQGPCITEDTALCFEAMNGLPGPYIKDFLAKLGHEGLNKMLDGFSTRAAWALCTFAYSAGPDSEPILFEGRTDGTLVPARGPAVFGWDPCFEPLGTGQTYAEMDPARKNSLSHRCKALEKLRAYLQSFPQE